MILVFGGQKGGGGKTTLAYHLAVWLQQAQRDVVVLGTDEQGSIEKWAARREQSGLSPIPVLGRLGNVEKTILDLKRRYEDIIIDCGGIDSEELRTALMVADVFIAPYYVGTLDFDTIPKVDSLYGQARRFNKALRGVSVLNRAPTNDKGVEAAEATEVLNSYSMPVATVIYDRKIVRQSSRIGSTAFESKDMKSNREFHLLADVVFGERGENQNVIESNV